MSEAANANQAPLLLPPDFVQRLRADAEAGRPDAQARLAFELARIGAFEEGRVWIEKAALGREAGAIREAGLWRLAGYGGEDIEGGIAYLTEAAEAGDGSARGHLATLRVSDLMGARDWDAAASDLIRATQAGDPRAALQLGLLLKADAPAALRLALLERAAYRGDPHAMYFMAMALFEAGSRHERAALRWLGSAGNSGSGLALAEVTRRGGISMTGWPARAFHTVEVPWDSLAGMLAWPHERTLPRAFPSDGHDRIWVLEGLLTVRECELLVASGALLMRNTNDGSAHVIKYGPTESSALIQSLDARVAQALGGAADHCERMTLMRHAPGQVNMVIGDGSIGLADPLLRRPATHIAAGVVRVLGEIAPLWFPRLNNLRVNCAQGGAVLWDLRGADGVFDERLTASDEAPQRDFRFSLIKARYDRPVSTGF